MRLLTKWHIHLNKAPSFAFAKLQTSLKRFTPFFPHDFIGNPDSDSLLVLLEFLDTLAGHDNFS